MGALLIGAMCIWRACSRWVRRRGSGSLAPSTSQCYSASRSEDDLHRADTSTSLASNQTIRFHASANSQGLSISLAETEPVEKSQSLHDAKGHAPGDSDGQGPASRAQTVYNGDLPSMSRKKSASKRLPAVAKSPSHKYRCKGAGGAGSPRKGHSK